MNEQRKHMKFSVFLRKNGRTIIGGFIIAMVVFCSIFAPLLTSWDPEKESLTEMNELPSSEHIMGTDKFGRDIWARVLYGSRTTLIVSIGAEVFLVIVGTILGLACGYYKRLEKVLMRILDAFATVPNLLLCMLMISVFGPGIIQMIIALAIHGIPGLARMVRNQVLSLREKEYIESEYAMGASDLRTLFKHILPACSSYLLVRFSNGLAGMVLSMTSLSFLGIGLDPTIASWGGIVQDGQSIMFAFPHLVFFPALAICITVFGFAMLGDGLRDRFDPRLR
ncbi:MAG: ABC transporter permease [Lachnospiraceae bacterium]|nr:ABC transporter permease [Lachnospiraceae bacterium]